MGSNEEHHPDLSALSWLFGVWESVEADVCYPTMDPVKYNEVIEFLPTATPMPYIGYKSETWHAEKKTKLHWESGFLRVDPKTQKVALLVSHFFGITEVSEGPVEEESLCLESQSLSEMSFNECVTVVKIVRKWALKEDGLHSTVLMQTAKHPLQLHLKCRYKKKN